MPPLTKTYYRTMDGIFVRKGEMTCSQLMVLCDAYRGTLNAERHCASYGRDLQYLKDRKLLNENWDITENGRELVDLLLLVSDGG